MGNINQNNTLTRIENEKWQMEMIIIIMESNQGSMTFLKVKRFFKKLKIKNQKDKFDVTHIQCANNFWLNCFKLKRRQHKEIK